MIHVYYSRIEPQKWPKRWSDKLDFLLPDERARILRFRFVKDRVAALAGQLLIHFALRSTGLPEGACLQIRRTPYGRPYLDESIDFNISHSGEYVVCCVGSASRVGIDIEEMRDIAFQDFEEVMNQAEWDRIKSSPKPQETFFQYWTKKESIIKADGRGLSVPLTAFEWMRDDVVLLDHRTWYLHPLAIDSRYAAHLAVDHDVQILTIEPVCLDDPMVR
jgi:4'-phosphopantetheinyl transferase